MGCDVPLPTPRLEFEGIGLDRCPGYYSRESLFLNDAFNVYAWRDKGFLPYSGTWMEQPNRIVETVELIDRLVSWNIAREAKRLKGK